MADLAGALALNLTAFPTAMIVGPALAGALLARGGDGTGVLALIYGANALSFLGVLAALVVMRTSGAMDAAPDAE